jgi:sulfite dehydrogenase
MTTRRQFLKATAAASASALAAPLARAAEPRKALGRVMIIGAGYGGATAAKYLRLWSGGAIEVLLVDRDPMFVSCPGSNLVLSGARSMAEISLSRNKLREYGIQVLVDDVTAVDLGKKMVKFRDRYADMSFDRLVVSPGVDFIYDDIPGLKSAEAQKRFLHAWKAGPETAALRAQLEAMPDGGTFVLSIPRAPYRCAPGPYERACQVALYFKRSKPRSKIVILDANEDITSKPALFRAAWNELYKGIIDYQPNAEVVDVDLKEGAVKTDFDTVKGDVINVLPPMRAADIARSTGLITANNRWCEVDWLTMESKAVKGVHVLGDATLAGPAMPKSGHMANQHGKLAAAAIVEIMNGRSPNPAPVVANTCYSFASDVEAMHISSVHRYDPAEKTLVPVHGAGGLSSRRSEIEGVYGWAWARNIWADMLA